MVRDSRGKYWLPWFWNVGGKAVKIMKKRRAGWGFPPGPPGNVLGSKRY